MAFLGFNTSGEEVHGDSAVRTVVKDGSQLGSLASATGFDPYNELSDTRYKTVLELVETVARSLDQNIDGIGAAAGIRAMASHWESHLLEGNPPSIVLTDLQDMQARISDAIAELTAALATPARPTAG